MENEGYHIVPSWGNWHIVFKDGELIKSFYGLRKAFNFVIMKEDREKYIKNK